MSKRQRKGTSRGRERGIPGGVPATLFERLRVWRANTAQTRNVPAYVIFHDATLRDIAIIRPATLDDLRQITGIGERKLGAYGAEILEIVAACG